jgi:Xaa-Pro aminopeptidase
MILSNEPGYYKPGPTASASRIWCWWPAVAVAGAEKEMLGFETLTFAPIDRSLIVADMLSPQERAWVDAYHARVLEVIGPQLEGEVRLWLEEQCRPLRLIARIYPVARIAALTCTIRRCAGR